MCFGRNSAEDKLNNNINKAIKQEHKAAPNSVILLLLGTGESGKSTILKQFRLLYGSAFTEAEIDNFKHQIKINILHAMIALCRAANLADFTTSAIREDVHYLASINGFETELTHELALRIHTVWNDPIIQQVYNIRSKLQVQSNAKLLLDSVVRVAHPEFIPTQQDILASKIRTTGVAEFQFLLDGAKFKILDLGGQRAERKKWHMFFQGISALIFVAALDDYDLKLREDERVNRMEDSITLFSQICNMPVFDDTSIILFFNKKDLFKEKLARSDLAAFFPDYPGGDYRYACSFVEKKYLDTIHTDKKLYTHFTCATSTKNIKQVFQDVRTSILYENLRATGFY